MIAARHAAQAAPRIQLSLSNGSATRKARRAGRSKPAPGDREIGGGIADRGEPSVDDCREPPVADQQITRMQVAVEPPRWISERDRQGGVPERCGGGCAGEEAGERLSHIGVKLGQRAAAPETVLARGGSGRRVNIVQDTQEAGEVSSQHELRALGQSDRRIPSIHIKIDQGRANSAPASNVAMICGIGSGRCGASDGRTRRSFLAAAT